MIRSLLIFIAFILVYSALRTVFRSVMHAYRNIEERPKVQGEEMVLDPNCRTYVPKGRALSRRIHGTLTYFCSDACARAYEDRNRK
jgi:YHS domain-containing protein